MNLQGIVAPLIGAVNPTTLCTMKMSTGYNTQPDGTRVPQFATFANIPCQVQPVSSSNLEHLDALNLQGTFKSVYLNGHWEGLNRAAIKGGDIIIMPDQTTWLVQVVPENWPDWTHMIVVLQNPRN